MTSSPKDRHWYGRAYVATSLALTRSRPRSTQYTATRAVAGETDWAQILRLYDQLLAFTPTPIVALHRAVAVAEVDGPAVALPLVDGLKLDSYHVYHAIRADLLRRLGRVDEAVSAYGSAIALTENLPEQTFLTRARERLQSSPSESIDSS